MSNLTRKTFEAIQPKFTELSNDQEFIKEVGFCLSIVKTTPQLQKATQESLLSAVYSVASVGLSLNPVKKEAYLVTRWNSRTRQTEAKLEPSYQGLIKLVTDTGSVTNIYAHLVYEGDVFEVNLGTETSVKHQPQFKSKKIQLAYAVAVLPNGGKQVEVMPLDEIHEIRERSESFKAYRDKKIKSCVWTTDEGEMCRKTVLRRIVKYLPKSAQWEKVAEAVKLDEADYIASPSTYTYVEELLRSSSVGEQQKEEIYAVLMGDMTQTEANKIITFLKDNQRDPIESGDNYSQTDIQNKLSQLNEG
jgi:phage RecT family recombinase